ncbi:hypothetical protein [Aeromicrobium wangtongii]|uniref:Uncharacterized protein n=1 Tax=Aeromicrobium wangtongii TaxID=2969247 RepID=A0ABY5MAL6_9ACTN|nr:hypothetical protein [Aeromicrobium wangtongii]MCD9197685.1 hypothetical protein [Aeromicrobium wangtongii]UUP15169.1 hypothetical protein NQV15_07630 [Aeromicrobium wangtongii]
MSLPSGFMPPTLDGRWFGTMNLSEPDVGSALGDANTPARRADDGACRVTGCKMCILQSGDQLLMEIDDALW